MSNGYAKQLNIILMYPIICSPMNSVSDVNLAVACHNAGILPSLVQFGYVTDGVFDIKKFENALAEFAELSNNGKLLVATDVKSIQSNDIISLFVKYNVQYVEILDCEAYNVRDMYNASIQLREKNIIVSPKLLAGHKSVKQIFDNIGPIDCVTIKGPNGAGRGLEGIVLEEEIVKIKQEFPNIILIVSGGINTSADIKRMISLGADWVSIGTMFCTSVESSMSVEAKNKIINATYTDTQKLSTGARQSSLVFSSIEEKDMNNTLGLYHGVRTGTSGHVYVGTGIDMISKIEPVQDIVNRLVQDL